MSRKAPKVPPLQLPTIECEAFQTSIQSFLQKQQKRRKRKGVERISSHQIASITRLCHHSIHVLNMLIKKRRALHLAITALEQMCTDGVLVLKMAIDPSASLTSSHRRLQGAALTSSQQRSIKTTMPSAKVTKEALPILLEVIKHILQHFFLSYIHIRDGIVLLTSGECRNQDDSLNAKNSALKFKSQMNQVGSRRRDGYTILYSSKMGYSGYGWDEFNNENVGLRVRLLDRLCRIMDASKTYETEDIEEGDGEETKEYSEDQRSRVWDTLLDLGAQNFEFQFDTHQTSMKELEDRLDRIRTKFMSEFEQNLCSLFTSIGATAGGATCQLLMKTKDKQEQLRFQVSKSDFVGLSTFSIQRQGDGSLGNTKNKRDGHRGLLPTGRNQAGWNHFMSLDVEWKKNVQYRMIKVHSNEDSNTDNVTDGKSCSGRTSEGSSGKKRKFVIEDDSDDDGDVDVGVDAGINERRSKLSSITIKEVKTKNTSHSNEKGDVVSASTAAIKQQLGVNVIQLQQSLETVQQEEICSERTAAIEEMDGQNLVPLSMNDIGDRSSNGTIAMGDEISLRRQPLAKDQRDLTAHLSSARQRSRNLSHRGELVSGRSTAAETDRPNPPARVILGMTSQSNPSSQQNETSTTRKRIENDDYFDNFCRDTEGNQSIVESESGQYQELHPPAVEYRKWGNDLLIEEGIPIDDYPSCAPIQKT